MIIKAIPESINKRLSEISSDKDTFTSAAPTYQEALNRSGHDYQLTYKTYPKKTDEEKKRKRSRQITWYNPPYDISVKTNAGKCFLTIVSDSFPAEHPLHKILW